MAQAKAEEEPPSAQDAPAPLHGVACQCPMCAFTILISTVSVNRQLTRHMSRPQIARARLVVPAPK